jgi:hypothetical protein
MPPITSTNSSEIAVIRMNMIDRKTKRICLFLNIIWATWVVSGVACFGLERYQAIPKPVKP